MPFCLIPSAPGNPIPMDKAILLIGRGVDCDIVLTQSRKVSRRHCCVVQSGDRLYVRDLGSKNGVRINGNTASRQARLNPGDTLSVGDVAFRIEFIKPPPRRVPTPRSLRGSQPVPLVGEPAPKLPVTPSQLSQDLPVALPEHPETFRLAGRGESGDDADNDSDEFVFPDHERYADSGEFQDSGSRSG